MFSVCPGWVQTGMGGSAAPLSVEDSVKTFEDLLTEEFFVGRARSEYQGRLIGRGKVLEI